MSVSAIEKELVEASGFKSTKEYERQDYLAMVARSMNEAAVADETVYDNLSVDAQDWFNDAVKALNKKLEIKEFPDVEAEEETDAEDAEGDDEGEEAGEASSEDEGDKPAKASKAKKHNNSAGAEDTPAPKQTKKGAPQHNPATPVSRELDKFGVGVKTQNHAALMMLEEGCRMSDITEKIGGTYYNLLKRIVKEGHKLEKSPNGMMKLTHYNESTIKRRRKVK